MTREEVKALLPVLTSYAEGGIIQQTDGYDWYDIDDPDFLASAKSYRIKPNPKYRPFANAKECWDELLKHQPFGVTGGKRGYNYGAFKSLCDDGCDFFGYENETFESAFDDIQFADGTPFGVKVE
mgnify:CR=1 FL=1